MIFDRPLQFCGRLFPIFSAILWLGCGKITSDGKREEMRRQKAQGEISLFMAVCESFHKDNGRFPTEEGQLYPRIEGSKDSYMITKIDRDPWGNPYKLELNSNKVSIASAGEDGKWGTQDDLSAISEGSK